MSSPTMCTDSGGADDEEAASSSSSSSSSSTTTSPLVDVEGGVLPNAVSPLHTMPGEFRSVLDEFRDNWERELKSGGQSGIATPTSTGVENIIAEASDILKPLPNVQTPEIDQQTQAESLFRRAVELEQRGKVYDALPLYRKAVQIVPDIEFKFYERQKLKTPLTAASAEAAAAKSSTEEAKQTPKQLKAAGEEEEEEDETVDDLYDKFQMDLANDYGGRLLLSSRDAGVISTELHLSDLPPEIVFCILRWVISTQLDMRSLEQCAAVCKGMYLCARDEDLWRLACVKVWGRNVGTLRPETTEANGCEPNDPLAAPLPPALEHGNGIIGDGGGGVGGGAPIALPSYNSWRQMFIERERVLFNGCYISKTTYLRMGENSFQDQYYRPVQLVEYFRYLRFMPDGSVLMMTNADEPAQGVPKLRPPQSLLRSDILRGHYRLYGSTVTILLQKNQPSSRFISNASSSRQRRGSAAFGEDSSCTKYCIEFRIVNTPKRKFGQLLWQRYSIVQLRNKIEASSEFDLAPSKYPPLWFSPVRSYHLDADAPLA